MERVGESRRRGVRGLGREVKDSSEGREGGRERRGNEQRFVSAVSYVEQAEEQPSHSPLDMTAGG